MPPPKPDEYGSQPRLRVVRAARDRFARLIFLAHRFDLRAHGLVGEAAERSRSGGFSCSTAAMIASAARTRVARLVSADRPGSGVAARDRRLGVGLDRALRRFQRAAGPVGAERAGLDDQDLDPERRDLLGERFGQALDGELGRRVIAGAGKADEAAHRRDVDDRARLLGPHDRQHRARHRGEAEKIGLEHGADVGVLALLDRGEIAVAGVVDEDVDAAERAARVGLTAASISACLSTSSCKREAVRRVAWRRCRRPLPDRAPSRRRGSRARCRIVASSRPKPVEQPVMSQTGFSRGRSGHGASLLVGAKRAAFSHGGAAGGNALDPVRSKPVRRCRLRMDGLDLGSVNGSVRCTTCSS